MRLYRDDTTDVHLGHTSVAGYQGNGFYISYLDTYAHNGNSVTYYLKLKATSSNFLDARVQENSSLTIQEII